MSWWFINALGHLLNTLHLRIKTTARRHVLVLILRCDLQIPSVGVPQLFWSHLDQVKRTLFALYFGTKKKVQRPISLNGEAWQL